VSQGQYGLRCYSGPRHYQIHFSLFQCFVFLILITFYWNFSDVILSTRDQMYVQFYCASCPLGFVIQCVIKFSVLIAKIRGAGGWSGMVMSRYAMRGYVETSHRNVTKTYDYFNISPQHNITEKLETDILILCFLERIDPFLDKAHTAHHSCLV